MGPTILPGGWNLAGPIEGVPTRLLAAGLLLRPALVGSVASVVSRSEIARTTSGPEEDFEEIIRAALQMQ